MLPVIRNTRDEQYRLPSGIVVEGPHRINARAFDEAVRVHEQGEGAGCSITYVRSDGGQWRQGRITFRQWD